MNALSLAAIAALPPLLRAGLAIDDREASVSPMLMFARDAGLFATPFVLGVGIPALLRLNRPGLLS